MTRTGIAARARVLFWVSCGVISASSALGTVAIFTGSPLVAIVNVAILVVAVMCACINGGLAFDNRPR